MISLHCDLLILLLLSVGICFVERYHCYLLISDSSSSSKINSNEISGPHWTPNVTLIKVIKRLPLHGFHVISRSEKSKHFPSIKPIESNNSTNSNNNETATTNHYHKRDSYDWGYWQDNGPHTWNSYFLAGLGREQSPVNIVMKSDSVGFDRLLQPIRFNYKTTNEMTLKNNGRGFFVEFNEKLDSTISGGPLWGRYQLARIDVHWGLLDDNGSEHRINCQGYAGELQFVHFNKAKYRSYDMATKYSDGLAVISVFLKLGYEANNNNRALAMLTKYLQVASHSFETVAIHQDLQLSDLLPENYEPFWTYTGSLTQPPLTENVIWIILRNPIEIAQQQLTAFRKVYPLNIRPVQPLNNRVIRASYMELK